MVPGKGNSSRAPCRQILHIPAETTSESVNGAI
jgi:hypothetical protein